MINDIALARAIHVLALVHWFGGVAVVTSIVLPQARRISDAKAAIEAFESFERRFVRQVRISILLAGITGVYLLEQLSAWNRFQFAAYWWLHLMVAIWIVFALMVFVLEPLVIHRLFHEFALRDKDLAFRVAICLHAIALTVSAIAIATGILGAHGAL